MGLHRCMRLVPRVRRAVDVAGAPRPRLCITPQKQGTCETEHLSFDLGVRRPRLCVAWVKYIDLISLDIPPSIGVHVNRSQGPSLLSRILKRRKIKSNSTSEFSEFSSLLGPSLLLKQLRFTKIQMYYCFLFYDVFEKHEGRSN